jgi:hypothetical protein
MSGLAAQLPRVARRGLEPRPLQHRAHARVPARRTRTTRPRRVRTLARHRRRPGQSPGSPPRDVCTVRLRVFHLGRCVDLIRGRAQIGLRTPGPHASTVCSPAVVRAEETSSPLRPHRPRRRPPRWPRLSPFSTASNPAPRASSSTLPSSANSSSGLRHENEIGPSTPATRGGQRGVADDGLRGARIRHHRGLLASSMTASSTVSCAASAKTPWWSSPTPSRGIGCRPRPHVAA